jgi:hypothetical protein
MKNFKKPPHPNQKIDLNPDDIMNDFNRLNDLLKGLDNIKEDTKESELDAIKATTNQIKEEFEEKYKNHLDTKDYETEKKEILKFGEEAKDEIENFKSNLDSLK